MTTTTPIWLEGELRLSGALDNRIIQLLKAIQQTGSLNQAAKQLGLSYKGAWQILERANQNAPQTLISTATGGNKGGGSYLTEAGLALVQLFSELEQQHRTFLNQLNENLAANLKTVLLLQRAAIKTSVRNQLFGRVIDIQQGAVNADVIVELTGGEQVISSVEHSALAELKIKLDADVVLLINSTDIILVTDADNTAFSARNCLAGRVLSIQQGVDSEVIILLPSGAIIAASITEKSVNDLKLTNHQTIWAVFKANAPMLGVL
ncbi:Molybdenum-pterin-binding protein MopA [Patescibacteria group bacterium]|nr:Molybdenum-pterin-binding protein MopA [Patescibacteria group bacterium]